MTKGEYLTKLKNLIQALPAEEQEEALAYYSDYFDDAESDDKVIEELGTPEELAKSIIEKFSCVLAKSPNTREENKSESNQTFTAEENSSYFEFEKSAVKNLGLSLGACNAVIKSGKTYKVEYRGFAPSSLRCEINMEGTLIIETKRGFNFQGFFSHEKKNRWCPRILITVPENAELENMKINLGAGQLKTLDLNILSKRTMIDVGAGNFEFSGLKSNASTVKCGMGNISLKGSLKGTTFIDCGMGAVNLILSDSSSDFSYDSKVALGSIEFNGEKRSGISQSYYGTHQENHISMNCGLGEIKVKFQK